MAKTKIDFSSMTEGEIVILIQAGKLELASRHEHRRMDIVRLANTPGAGRCVGCGADRIGDCGCPAGALQVGDWVPVATAAS